MHAVQHGGIKTEEDLLVCHKGVHLSNPDPVVFLLLVFIVSCQCFLSVVIMCINTPLFLPFPSVLHPLVCPPQTVQIQIYTQCCSPLPVLLLLSLCATPSRSLLFFLSLSFFIPPIHCMLQWQVFKEQLHTRVVLVAVEIWTDKDHIPISVRPLEMLRDFAKYRQQSIKHHADAVHLIS